VLEKLCELFIGRKGAKEFANFSKFESVSFATKGKNLEENLLGKRANKIGRASCRERV